MKKKIVIFGHYGVPNWGDEGILEGILTGIDTKQYSITVVSAHTEYTKNTYSVNSVSPPPFGIRSFFSGWIKGIQAIQDSDYIIFGGGGLFQANPPKALRLWDWYLRVCLAFQKKIFFVGQSFADISSLQIGQNQKKRIQHVSFFSVRDKHSSHILQTQWGVHPSKIQNSTDAVFFLSRSQPALSSSKKQKKVIFCMREGDLSFSQESDLLKHVYQVFPKHQFVCLVMQSFQSHDERFPQRHSQYPWKTVFPKTVQEVMDEIKSSEMVFSSRLHGSIFSVICGTPFGALGCRSKISNLIPAHRVLFPKEFSNPNFFHTIASLSSKTDDIESFRKNEEKKLSLFFPEILI